MNKMLDVLKSALENRREDIINDVNLTNDIVIDDVMCSLGYNMKRDRAVKRIYNSTVDWEVQGKNGEKCFIVKTIALGQEITNNDLEEAFLYGKQNGYPFVIVANGDIFKVYAYFEYEGNYIIIDELNIDKEETEQLTKLFESMKKTIYNKDEIYKIFYDNYLDVLKVKAMLLSSIDNIVKSVSNNVGLYDSSKLKVITERILTSEQDISNGNSEELLKAKAEVTETKEKLDNTTKKLSEAEAKVEQVNTELVETTEKLDIANAEIEKVNTELVETIEKLEETTEQLSKSSESIDELNDKYNKLNNYLVELTEERDKLFSEKEDLILKINELEKLNEQKVVSEVKVESVQFVDRAMLDEMQSREDAVQAKEEEIQAKEKDINEKCEEIAAREEELSTLEHNLSVKEKDLSLREEEIIQREKEVELAKENVNAQNILAEQENDEDDFLGLGNNKENTEESDELLKENEELKEKVAKLEIEIDKLNKKVKVTLDELIRTKDELEKAKTNVNEHEQLENSLLDEELIKKISELETKEENLSNYNNQLMQEVNDLKYKLSLVDNPEAYTNERVRELENERNVLEAERISLLKSVDDFKKAKDDAEERENKYKFEAEERIQKLKDRVKKLEDENNFRAYEQQINDLTEERDTALEDIKRLNKKVAQLTQELDELSGGEMVRANELLDMIIVAPGQPDTFAGVINTELYQNQDLRRFVGISLQKLHALKLNEAFNYIWDGDMFQYEQVEIKDKPHCVLSGKGYNIVNEELTPLIAFSKLKVIYSHFEDIIFECRMVQSTGYKNIDTLKAEAMREDIMQSSGLTLEKKEPDYTEESYTEETVNEFIEEQSSDYVQDGFTEEQSDYVQDGFTEEYNEYNPEYNNVEDYNAYSQSSADGFAGYNPAFDELNAVMDASDFDVNNEESNYIESKLYVTELLSYQDLMMTDREIKFNGIKYIGTDTSTFEIINSDNLDKTLSKCVDAILAIEEFNGNKAVASIKNIDFDGISRFIYKFTPDMSGSVKITGTKFCVSGLNDVYDLIETLCVICEKLCINMQSWFIYLEGSTLDNYFEPWETSETAVGTIYILEPEVGYEYRESAIVIKGLIVNNTVLTKNSLDYRCKLFGRSLGIKTEYISQQVKQYSDYLDALKIVAHKAIESGKTFEDLIKCKTIDGKSSIISYNLDDVRDEYDEVVVANNKVYISKIFDWEQAETIVRMHVTLFGNNKIAVKTVVDNGYYEFLRDQFFTSEPSLELAIASLINYIESANSK